MKTLVNFRDAGGFKTKENALVKMGKIYRSGEIVNLCSEDKEAFQNKYDIKTIFDLRGEKEVAEQPDDVFNGVEYVNIDIMKDSQGQSASLDDMVKETDSAEAHMKQIYRDIILTKSGRHGYQEFLTNVAQDDKPFIFHCFAGKDRTGIAAALILGILGVSDEDIYADYLKTNELRKPANEKTIELLRSKGMSEKELAEVNVMLSVKKDYLDIASQTITENFGNLIQYVEAKDGLDLPKSLVTDMKKLYTE